MPLDPGKEPSGVLYQERMRARYGSAARFQRILDSVKPISPGVGVRMVYSTTRGMFRINLSHTKVKTQDT